VIEVDEPGRVRRGSRARRTSWEHIPDPERSKAAKKAAATRGDDSTTTARRADAWLL
jgi:hypothetical protein